MIAGWNPPQFDCWVEFILSCQFFELYLTKTPLIWPPPIYSMGRINSERKSNFSIPFSPLPPFLLSTLLTLFVLLTVSSLSFYFLSIPLSPFVFLSERIYVAQAARTSVVFLSVSPSTKRSDFTYAPPQQISISYP